MPFINDYLTNSEKEIFKEKAIPTGVFWKDSIIGYEPNGRIRCTLDWDKHIYLSHLD